MTPIADMLGDTLAFPEEWPGHSLVYLMEIQDFPPR